MTCASGIAPRNASTIWPPMIATTIGMDCAWKAWASRGFASTSTLASTQAPLASLASFSSTGLSCLHGPHHSAHRSTITGVVRDRLTTSSLKVSSVTSKTDADACPAPASAAPSPGAALAARAAACCLRWAAACRAPRSTAPYMEKSRGCCMLLFCLKN